MTKSAFAILSFPLGTALLFAALFTPEGTIVSPVVQGATPTATSARMERLQEPTLPPAPSQADHGAQVFWLHCLPCHGERGQGLTEEFRETYPPEEQDCWKSGCHGRSPYEYGFSLPTQIAAVIGQGSLQKFATAANLRGFIGAAMPFWNPGSLTDEQYWQVTAFLLRENGLWDGVGELDASNAGGIRVGVGQATATPGRGPVSDTSGALPFVAGAVLVLSLLVAFVYIQQKRRAT